MALELIPNGDLVFKGPFNTVSTTTLKLSNNGNSRLAYKIKTTAPRRYCVKPNSGFLDAHSTTSVQVMLQPHTAGTADDRTKHKFMVQWVAVPTSFTEDVDNFWKQDLKDYDVRDSKLRCSFIDEPQPAVVPDDQSTNRVSDSNVSTNLTENRTEQKSSSSSPLLFTQKPSPICSVTTSRFQSQNQDRQQDLSDDASKPRIQQEIERLKAENNSLKEKIKQQDSGPWQRSTAGSATSNRTTPSLHQQIGATLFGVPLTEQLVLVACAVALLFGFSFGYFLFSCSN